MVGKRFLSWVPVLLAVLSAAVPAAAQQSRANPYRNLFQPRDLKEVARAQQDREPKSPRPRVVCGMTIIPADPKIDPKMVIERPRDGVRYTIRAVPPACAATER